MAYFAGLQKGPKIGDGSFGEIFKCTDPVHGIVAAKHFYASKFPSTTAWMEACQRALTEAQNLKALEHPNILKVHNVLITNENEEFLIVTEYCDRKSSRELTSGDKFTLIEARKISRDASIGLNYIHSQGYLHRDVKPENTFLKSTGEVKVGDFGLVTDNLQFGFATPYGTPIYWAPEVLTDKTCSKLSDVYSLGATFLNLVSGDKWFWREGRKQILREDANGWPSITNDFLYLPHVTTAWRNTINRLIRSDKTRRPSMSEAVNIVSRLPSVEDWLCEVNDDTITWNLKSSKRNVLVKWDNYLRNGEEWAAWSEPASGSGKKHTLARSDPACTWIQNYRRLQEFFESRLRKP